MDSGVVAAHAGLQSGAVIDIHNIYCLFVI